MVRTLYNELGAEYTAVPISVDGVQITAAVSNVARIGRATLMDDEVNGFEQVVYYQTGLFGDQEKGLGPRQGMQGLGLTSNVREAYGFICNNYDYGDEIYISGFSRGASTARSVARCYWKMRNPHQIWVEFLLSSSAVPQRIQQPVSQRQSQMSGDSRGRLPSFKAHLMMF